MDIPHRPSIQSLPRREAAYAREDWNDHVATYGTLDEPAPVEPRERQTRRGWLLDRWDEIFPALEPEKKRSAAA